MHQGQWEEAEKDLMEAVTKDGKDPETLANLVVVNLHLGCVALLCGASGSLLACTDGLRPLGVVKG